MIVDIIVIIVYCCLLYFCVMYIIYLADDAVIFDSTEAVSVVLSV